MNDVNGNKPDLTLLTATQVADKLNVRPPTMRAWINKGWVPGGFKPGGGRVHRFNPIVIDEWINAGCPRPLKRDKPQKLKGSNNG